MARLRLEWRLREYLQERGIPEWRLSRAIQGLGYRWDLRRIYRLRRPPRYLDLRTLEAILEGLRSLGHEAKAGEILAIKVALARRAKHRVENPTG